MKFNRHLLPIKAHFFFFFAALGPLLPQINVFGRQLGISASTMGMVTAVLPLLWATAKPLFGYLVDYFTSMRKLIFMLLIMTMTGSYCSLWFLPMPTKIPKQIYKTNETIRINIVESNTNFETLNCHWSCSNGSHFEFYSNSTNHVLDTFYVTNENRTCSFFSMKSFSDGLCVVPNNCSLLCSTLLENNGVYVGATVFWCFVIFNCLGTVAFNVANCIGDAVCFDVLGPDRPNQYGSQRAWGTVGYGLTAFLGGWLVDLYSPNGIKDFTPAFLLALTFTCFDLFCSSKLKLPPLSSPNDSGKALRELLKVPKVVIFIIFAIIAGTFDSFIIYYCLWFLEDIAESTGYMGNIKLIEGTIVAAQSFIGELLFFFVAGKILKRFGFGWTMSFSFLCYGIRMAAISVLTNPWYFVLVEGILQGPTYALCYTSIVSYAANVAPDGYSATVQGVVAGMDDGVGFALGSLIGGQMYSKLGPRTSFQLMAVLAFASSVLHIVLFRIFNKVQIGEVKNEESLPEGEKMLVLQTDTVYKDTVEPL